MPRQECDVRICRDLASALESWGRAVATYSDTSGLLHTGFARPDTGDVQALLERLPPGLYVTEAARHAVPRECAVQGQMVGTCQGRDLAAQRVYRAIGEWFGVVFGDDAEPVAPDSPMPVGDGSAQSQPHAGGPPASWLADLWEDEPHAVAALESENVRTDEEYQVARVGLPEPVRVRIDRHRFRALTEGVAIVDPFVIAHLLPDWAASAPLRALGLSQRCTNVFRNAGLRTVADVLALGPIGLMDLRNFGRTSLREFTERVYHFVADLNGNAIAHPDKNAAPRIRDVVSEAQLGGGHSGEENGMPSAGSATALTLEPQMLHAALVAALAGLRERDATALRLWLGTDGPPKILEDIGGTLGVTRERARQLRNRAWERIGEHYRWPHEVVLRIDALLNVRAEPLYLDLIAADDPWFDGFQENLVALKRVIEDLTGDAVHVWPLNGRLIATRCSAERWPELADAARAAVEREIPAGVTRSDARILIGAVAIGEGTPDLAVPLWQWLAPSLHFAMSPCGEERLVSIGRGLRHPLAAILNESDRPLHMKEIIERLCQRGYVMNTDYATQNMVRNATREAGGVLYGRSVYGLEKHLPVSPEVAEEALTELEAIILEGAPDRQWHCSELADALSVRRPDLEEELDPFTVNVILRRSSDLTYLGRLVWVGARRAEEAQDRLEVAAMCEAALVKAGRPLTKRELRDAILQVRGLNHNFLPQSSERIVRLAHGMWGLVNRDVGVSAENQRAALDALFGALEARQKGLHVSELLTALGDIGFNPDPELDEWELLGIAQSDPRFRIGRGQLTGLTVWENVRRRAIGQALADLQARWTGPITADDLHGAVCALMERGVSRTSVMSHAARTGFVYHPATGLWDVADVSQEAGASVEEEEEE